MKRIYSGFAYSDAPRANCWWDRTCDLPERPTLQGDLTCDVAVIGAGFTGLSAALHLAKEGVSVAVVDAERVGWGASGRNGGFCCLGGGMLDNAALEARFGPEGRRDWRATEAASVRFVQDLIRDLGIDVDRHSEGETRLAHRPSDFEAMKREAEEIEADYGVTPRLTKAADLRKEGMNAGFHGGLTTPLGFALNPRKYLAGLAKGAEDAGARIFEGTPAHAIRDDRPGFSLDTPGGRVRAGRIIVATNGYSSEDLPDWLRGRYMPTQSSVIVTRPLTQTELDGQGWTSAQACYDTRRLLHYFRLMPDRRMLFGVRGGLLSNPRSEKRALARARRDFEAMFPSWKHVETPHGWSGMVCIARDRMPFVGPVPGREGLFASLCYHGNGVAMGSYSGAIVAELAQGRKPSRLYPEPMKTPLSRFELGRFRRAVMPTAYAAFALADR